MESNSSRKALINALCLLVAFGAVFIALEHLKAIPQCEQPLFLQSPQTLKECFQGLHEGE